ncbi:MAG TPA: DUF2334 domain-containing protein, partial [Dehalococcoidia bacterium]|nr:DUF2334 domain-containing protein [Dehalococcoidia bacterium]
MRARAIWSVHDVSAESFERARHLIAAIEAAGIAPLCILIVPHGAWTEGQRSTLRDWERAGHVLGLHGWSHRATPPQTLYHRAHAAILSRDTAEHLGLDARAVADLINRGVRWFADAGLAAPQLYVPPAWALGALRSESLPAPPFRWIETLTGI